MLFKTYECRRINVEQTLPSRENKNAWEKITAICFLYHSGGPLLVAGATTFPPA